MSGSTALKTCPCEGFRHQERRAGSQGRKVKPRNMPKPLPAVCRPVPPGFWPQVGRTVPERAAALSKHSATTVCSESSLACALMASDSSSNQQMLLEII